MIQGQTSFRGPRVHMHIRILQAVVSYFVFGPPNFGRLLQGGVFSLSRLACSLHVFPNLAGVMSSNTTALYGAPLPCTKSRAPEGLLGISTSARFIGGL